MLPRPTLSSWSLLSIALASASVVAQTTTHVSLAPNSTQLAGSTWGCISGDGRVAAFVSTDPAYSGVVVRNLATGAVRRASETAAGVQANALCFTPRLSRDGRYVAFASAASNLAPNDTNGFGTDVFLKDLQTGALLLVSADAAGIGGNGHSYGLDLSGDGRFVSFYSEASNLVPNDTSTAPDAYLLDRVTGQLVCLSLDPGTGLPTGIGGNGSETSLSGDGRFVVFRAKFGTVNAAGLLDRTTGVMQPIAFTTAGVFLDGVQSQVSTDGSTVVFATHGRCDPLDTDSDMDVFVLDVATGTRHLISKAVTPSGTAFWNGTVSGDGQCVSFLAQAPLVPADTNDEIDSYLVDRRTASLELLTSGVDGQIGNGTSAVFEVSDDGRKALFVSEADNLVANDTNGNRDMFVRDRAALASSQLYGAGLAGTTGAVPGIALLGDPRLGTTPSLIVANLTGVPTATLLVLGVQPAATITPWVGTLLVEPLLLEWVAMPSPVLQLPLGIPDAFVLNGLQVYFQALVIDAGAAASVAFTRGLQVTVGG